MLHFSAFHTNSDVDQTHPLQPKWTHTMKIILLLYTKGASDPHSSLFQIRDWQKRGNNGLAEWHIRSAAGQLKAVQCGWVRENMARSSVAAAVVSVFRSLVMGISDSGFQRDRT